MFILSLTVAGVMLVRGVVDVLLLPLASYCDVMCQRLGDSCVTLSFFCWLNSSKISQRCVYARPVEVLLSTSPVVYTLYMLRTKTQKATVLSAFSCSFFRPVEALSVISGGLACGVYCIHASSYKDMTRNTPIVYFLFLFLFFSVAGFGTRVSAEA